jgi:hypothetical protein
VGGAVIIRHLYVVYMNWLIYHVWICVCVIFELYMLTPPPPLPRLSRPTSAYICVYKQGAEIVQTRLGRHVTKNCEALIEGMRTVHEMDNDLRLGGLIAGNSRRLLIAADSRLTKDVLGVVKLEKRRERLISVQKVVTQVNDLLSVEINIAKAVKKGDIGSAISLAVDAQVCIDVASDSMISLSLCVFYGS